MPILQMTYQLCILALMTTGCQVLEGSGIVRKSSRPLFIVLAIVLGWLLSIFLTILVASTGLRWALRFLRSGKALDLPRFVELPGLMRLPWWTLIPLTLMALLIGVLTVWATFRSGDAQATDETRATTEPPVTVLTYIESPWGDEEPPPHPETPPAPVVEPPPPGQGQTPMRDPPGEPKDAPEKDIN